MTRLYEPKSHLIAQRNEAIRLRDKVGEKHKEYLVLCAYIKSLNREIEGNKP